MTPIGLNSSLDSGKTPVETGRRMYQDYWEKLRTCED
jgi:hypothetical protein